MGSETTLETFGLRRSKKKNVQENKTVSDNVAK